MLLPSRIKWCILNVNATLDWQSETCDVPSMLQVVRSVPLRPQGTCFELQPSLRRIRVLFCESIGFYRPPAYVVHTNNTKTRHMVRRTYCQHGVSIATARITATRKTARSETTTRTQSWIQVMCKQHRGQWQGSQCESGTLCLPATPQ